MRTLPAKFGPLFALLLCAFPGPRAKGAEKFHPGDAVTLATVFACDSKQHMIDLVVGIQTNIHAAYHLVVSGHCFAPSTKRLFVVVDSQVFKGLPLLCIHAKDSNVLWWTLYNGAKRQ